VNSALAGWFHPYGRMLGDDLVECHWSPYRYTGKPRSFAIRLRDQVVLFLWSLPWGRDLFTGSPLALRFLPISIYWEEHKDKYVDMLAETRRLATDPRLGLVFVHWPIPHGPPVYDRNTRRLGGVVYHRLWYFDNLALVDHTLAELRAALEKAGLWESTTILISSDHAWREAFKYDGKLDRRVPFLLKLAGQEEGAEYDAEFNTVLSAELTLAILRGEIKSHSDVATWLDAHRGDAPVIKPLARPRY
jgi:hypothetical protein